MRFCVLTAFISQLSLAASCESPNPRQLVTLELPPSCITMPWTCQLMAAMFFFLLHSHLSPPQVIRKRALTQRGPEAASRRVMGVEHRVFVRGCVNASLFFLILCYFCRISALYLWWSHILAAVACSSPPSQAAWDDLGKTVEMKCRFEVSFSKPAFAQAAAISPHFPILADFKLCSKNCLSRWWILEDSRVQTAFTEAVKIETVTNSLII